MKRIEPALKQIEDICRKATRCRVCFESGKLKPPYVDIAQPRYIGPGYWTAKRKIAVAMLNPGAGGANAADRTALRLIRGFCDGEPLAPVLEQQRIAMPDWADGKYVKLIKDLGLDLDAIATLNVAWCATDGNKYPAFMLKTCWEHHTAPLLNALSPHLIVLSGSDSHQFAPRINVKTVCTIHYANRSDNATRAQVIEAARREIEA